MGNGHCRMQEEKEKTRDAIVELLINALQVARTHAYQDVLDLMDMMESTQSSYGRWNYYPEEEICKLYKNIEELRDAK